jgi:hypothetical protein
MLRLERVFIRAQACGGAPPGISFVPWLVAVTAIVYFVFSNQRTASVNLGLPLADASVSEDLTRAAVALLGGAPPPPDGRTWPLVQAGAAKPAKRRPRAPRT